MVATKYTLVIRKLLLYHTNVMESPPMATFLSKKSSSFLNISSTTIVSQTPTPSPSPFPLEEYTNHNSPQTFLSLIQFSDSAFDLATICMIFSLIVLSILCMSFIFHLFLKSRRLQHLQNFNSFWIVRLALITFAMVWALNEVFRLSIFRRKYFSPFLPLLTLTQQSNLCKIHVVFSFGFLQPGFFITLIFLVNMSIKKNNLHCIWPFASICAMCSPLVLLHTFFVFYPPLENIVPKFMHITSILYSDLHGNKMVLCTYPLFSCIIFAGFAIAYAIAFLFSSWRVVAFVINKSIRIRINVLSFTVMICLPVQIVCLGIFPLFLPQDPAYYLVRLVMFIDVAFCMAVGQIILVLKPIADALAAGGECCQWRPDIKLGRPQMLDDGGWQIN